MAAVFLIDNKSSSRISLKSKTLLGRATGLSGPGISREHCVIKSVGGDFFVADVNSTYGTFLNGKRLAPNEWHPLTTRDNLRVGLLIFNLEFGDRDAFTSAPTKLAPLNRAVVVETSAEANEPNVGAGDDADEESPAADAGIGRRLAAFMLDGLLMRAFGYVFGVFFAAAAAPSAGMASGGGVRLAPFLIFFVAMSLIYVVVELTPMILWGQTLGKKIMRLKVVDLDGKAIDWRRVVLRDILLKRGIFISISGVLIALGGAKLALLGMALGLGLVLFKTHLDRRIYWDRLAKTRVIRLS